MTNWKWEKRTVELEAPDFFWTFMEEGCREADCDMGEFIIHTMKLLLSLTIEEPSAVLRHMGRNAAPTN